MNIVQLAVRRACEDPNIRTQANLARLLSEAVARRVAPVRIQQWLSGRRPVPPHLCPAIERLTEQRVRCWELRPDDWYLLWPTVIGMQGAPAVPAPANDAQALEAA